MPWFRVEDLGGSVWTTADAEDSHVSVIAFLSRHSPHVKHIERHFGPAADSLIAQNVMVLGISSNDALAYPSDSRKMLAEQLERAGFTFPYGVDENQQAAKAFQASCTPEFFVYDREHRLVYHGQYDSSRPDNDIPVTGDSVLQAVDATRRGDVVNGDQQASLGCSIKWCAGNEPAYALAL